MDVLGYTGMVQFRVKIILLKAVFRGVQLTPVYTNGEVKGTSCTLCVKLRISFLLNRLTVKLWFSFLLYRLTVKLFTLFVKKGLGQLLSPFWSRAWGILFRLVLSGSSACFYLEPISYTTNKQTNRHIDNSTTSSTCCMLLWFKLIPSISTSKCFSSWQEYIKRKFTAHIWYRTCKLLLTMHTVEKVKAFQLLVYLIAQYTFLIESLAMHY